MNERLPNPANFTDERKVGMGELEIIRSTGVLRTLLGSCVGLVLQDQQRRIGGLAHIVLPFNNGSDSHPGKYADTAIPELIRLIEKSGGSMRNLSAKFAGGANMFSTAKSNTVGEQNLAIVEALLKDAGIPVSGRHSGGIHGRRMAFHVETGKVIVEVVGGSPVEL